MNIEMNNCNNNNNNPDNEIKNELLDLANQVTNDFASSSLEQDDELKYESFSNDKVGEEDEDKEFELPQVDWEGLEAKLKQAQLEINTQVIFFLFYL